MHGINLTKINYDVIIVDTISYNAMNILRKISFEICDIYID